MAAGDGDQGRTVHARHRLPVVVDPTAIDIPIEAAVVLRFDRFDGEWFAAMGKQVERPRLESVRHDRVDQPIADDPVQFGDAIPGDRDGRRQVGAGRARSAVHHQRPFAEVDFRRDRFDRHYRRAVVDRFGLDRQIVRNRTDAIKLDVVMDFDRERLLRLVATDDPARIEAKALRQHRDHLDAEGPIRLGFRSLPIDGDDGPTGDGEVRCGSLRLPT